MTNEQSEIQNDEQAVVSKSHDHFNPVIVTDTIGSVFLGSISLILLGAVAGLLFYIRKLEEKLRERDSSSA